MNRHRATNFFAFLLFIGLAVVMTWPQARHLTTHVSDSDDPLLSIWRLAWIAHILPIDPAALADGNIFHPEPRTLAYTDAVLMQGVSAAPLIWMGLAPLLVYNIVLLASMALSGWTMFLYARHLTQHVPASLLAGIVFAFVPFRFDHLHHLELQATMFLPLALLWVDRAFESGARRDVWLAVAAVVAQVYCGIYYAVFLGTALLLVIPLRWRHLPADRRRRLLPAAAAAALTGAIVVAPYLSLYLLNRGNLGDRSLADIQLYSATLSNYLATPDENLVHGRWSGPLGQNERRLFPGVIAMALAIVGAWHLERRRVTLLVVAATGFVISLGLNTPLYSWLSSVLFIYNGLRAPARASILVYLALAGLVAFGWAHLARARRPAMPWLAGLVAVALLAEYATVQARWFIPGPAPQVYTWLATQPRSVVVELPLTTTDRLDRILDGIYMFRSIEHWQPLLNGYSGFFPRSYLELLEEMETFPDERSVAYLKARHVDFVVVHGGLMPPDRAGQLTAAMLAHPDLVAVGQFEEAQGQDLVFRLRR